MFNVLTGGSVRVGNYPGISVDRAEGDYRYSDDLTIHLIDLPGTYSLTAYSQDELVARNVIVRERPDVVINMLDVTALERSLYLTVQNMEIGAPIVVGLNMMDEARRKHIQVDAQKLSQLLGVPVVECVARKGSGSRELMEASARVAGDQHQGVCWNPLRISYGADIDPVLDEMVEVIQKEAFMTELYPARWIALKYLEEDEAVMHQGRHLNRSVSEQLEIVTSRLSGQLQATRKTYPEALIADYRYGFIHGLLQNGVITRLQDDDSRFDVSDRLDRVVTHRILGPLIMLGVLYALFYNTFTLGAYPQAWAEQLFGLIAVGATRVLPSGMLQSLVVSGVIEGVGAVLSFTPLIFVMFIQLVFLEDLGYMGRVAYMLDKVMHIFGLHGASVMPLIVSGGLPGGCAVPGIMAARTLRSRKERLATIFVAPFTVCGAKATAFLMLTAAFFPKHGTDVMFILVLISWVAVLMVARILRWTVIRGEPTPFVMELPPYRLPTLRGIWMHTCERVWQYIKKAGTFILAITIIMWAVTHYPKLSESDKQVFDGQREQITSLSGASSSTSLSLLSAVDEAEHKASLQVSYAGKMAMTIEPLSRYAGFPWHVNIALIGAFAAKEVFVSTMATIYSVEGGDAGSAQVSQRLARDPAFTMPAVISLYIFLLLYAPCMVTMGTLISESGWRWAFFTLFGSLLFSFCVSVAVYQLGMLIAGS